MNKYSKDSSAMCVEMKSGGEQHTDRIGAGVRVLVCHRHSSVHGHVGGQGETDVARCLVPCMVVDLLFFLNLIDGMRQILVQGSRGTSPG